MRTRFYNARVLTMEPEKEIFFGEVWVDGNKIVFAGTDEEKAGQKDAVRLV